MVKSDQLTKQYLKDTLDQFKGELKTELLEIKEEIVGEIKGMREEFDTHQYSHTRINDELHEHDDRLKVLETAKI